MLDLLLKVLGDLAAGDIDVLDRADKSGLKPDGCIYKTTGRDEMLKLVSSYLKS